MSDMPFFETRTILDCPIQTKEMKPNFETVKGRQNFFQPIIVLKEILFLKHMIWSQESGWRSVVKIILTSHEFC